jgi:hypothetical protein
MPIGYAINTRQEIAMTRLTPLRIGVALVLACAAMTLPATASESGKTKQGRPFVTGGVSIEELTSLYGKRDAYTLWVVTAARRSGAHLSDVAVRIADANKNTVYEGRLAGPWLFVDLPLGRYEIEARFDGETQKHITTIHTGDLHQSLFYFDVKAEVSPDWQSPFPRGAYSGRKE